MRQTHKTLAFVSIGYLLSASIGTLLAVLQGLPANFGGFLHGKDVLIDFLTLNGTALSPPLIFMLLQAFFTVLLFHPGRAVAIGLIGLTILGGIYTLAQVGEPIFLRMFTRAGFNPLHALILAANETLSILMVILSVRTYMGRRAFQKAG